MSFIFVKNFQVKSGFTLMVIGKKHWLIFIFMLALSTRFFGLNYGLPYTEMPDEEVLIRATLDMGRYRLSPNYYQVPHLMFNLTFPVMASYYAAGRLTGKFSSPKSFAASYFRDITPFFLIGRGMSAFVSSLTVLLLAVFLWRLWGRRAALLGSLLLIFFPLDVSYAHLVRPDTYLNLCGLGVIFFSFRLLESRKWSNFLLSGLLIGIAWGAKYNGLAYGLYYLMGFLLGVKAFRDIFSKTEITKFVTGLLMIPVGAVIATPYCFINFKKFMGIYSGQLGHVTSRGHLGFESVNGWLYYLFEGFPKTMTIPLEIMAILGVFIALVRHRKTDLFFLVFPLAYFLYIGSWQTTFPRYYYPLIIPFVIFIVIAFEFLIEKFPFLQWNTWSRILLAALILALPVSQVLQTEYYYTRPSTRLIAKEWIENNLPANSKIAMENYGPHIRPGKEEYERRLAKLEARGKPALKVRYLLENYDDSIPGFDWEYIWKKKPKDPVRYLIENGFDYAIINERNYRAAYHKDSVILHPETTSYYQRYYDYLWSNFKPIKEFIPASKYALGSRITIFKLK